MVGKTSPKSKASLAGYLSDTLKADPEQLARVQAERTAESRLMEMQRMIGANATSYQETGQGPGNGSNPYTDYRNSMTDYAKKNGIWYDDKLIASGSSAYKYVLDLNVSLGRTDLIAAKTASEEYGPEAVKGGRADLDSILYKELGRAKSEVGKEQFGKLKEQYPFVSEAKMNSAADRKAQSEISKIKSETDGAPNSPFIKYALIKQALAAKSLYTAVVSGYREELEREVSAYQKNAEEKMRSEYATAQRQKQHQQQRMQSRPRPSPYAQQPQQQPRRTQSQKQQPNGPQQQQPFDINQLLAQLGGGEQTQEPKRKQK